ncbi:hypothetical protein RI367_006255 [Sorochytrium milnesiophthora]
MASSGRQHPGDADGGGSGSSSSGGGSDNAPTSWDQISSIVELEGVHFLDKYHHAYPLDVHTATPTVEELVVKVAAHHASLRFKQEDVVLRHFLQAVKRKYETAHEEQQFVREYRKRHSAPASADATAQKQQQQQVKEEAALEPPRPNTDVVMAETPVDAVIAETPASMTGSPPATSKESPAAAPTSPPPPPIPISDSASPAAPLQPSEPAITATAAQPSLAANVDDMLTSPTSALLAGPPIAIPGLEVAQEK